MEREKKKVSGVFEMGRGNLLRRVINGAQKEDETRGYGRACNLEEERRAVGEKIREKDTPHLHKRRKPKMEAGSERLREPERAGGEKGKGKPDK